MHQIWLRLLPTCEVAQIDSVADTLRTGRLRLAPTYQHRCGCWLRRVPLDWMRSESWSRCEGSLENGSPPTERAEGWGRRRDRN